MALHRDAPDALGFDGVLRGRRAVLTGLRRHRRRRRRRRRGRRRPYLARGLDFVAPSPSSEVVRLTAVDRLPRLVAGFLAVVSVITLAHAAAVTVRRRRRDLAMLRVLGFCRPRPPQHRARPGGGALAPRRGGRRRARTRRWVASSGAAWPSSVSLPTVITLPAPAIVLVPLVIAVLAQIGAAFSRRAAGRIPAAIALRAE